MSIRLGSFIEAAAATISADQISTPVGVLAAPLKRRSTEAQFQRQAPRLFVPITTRPGQREATAAA